MRINSRRYNRLQTHILVWCGDEPLEISYDAVPILVPPVNKIATLGIGSPYRVPSAVSKSGVPLPGTLVVSDVIQENSEGGVTHVFKVSDFCAFLERDCAELFSRGFNIVTDPDDVRPVQEEGRPLYEESLDAQAGAILDAELMRQKKYEDQGRPVPQADNEKQVIWAYRHKQKRGAQKPAISKDLILAAIHGTYTPELPVMEDGSVAVKSAAGLIEECDALGINLTKPELTALIRNKPDEVAFVLEKIALKKRERVGRPEEAEAPA